MTASPITQQEIQDGQVFTTVGALPYRFYVVKDNGYNKVMNDVNKSHYAFIEYFNEFGFKVLGKFFGQTMSLFIKYEHCIKIID